MKHPVDYEEKPETSKRHDDDRPYVWGYGAAMFGVVVVIFIGADMGWW